MKEGLGMGAFDDALELSVDGNPFGNDDISTEDQEQDDINNDDAADADDSDDETNHGGEDEDPDTVADDENDDADEGGENNSPNLYSSVATVLQEQGLLPSLDIDDTKIETVDDLANAFTTQVDDLVKTKLVEKVGESAYEYLINGIPLEQVEEYKANDDYLTGLDENKLADDLELSKKIIYQDYINQGFSEARATRLVDRTASLGEDSIIEDAMDSLESVKAYNTKYMEDQKNINIQAQAAAAESRVANERKLKDSVYGTKELLKGQPISKAIQDKVFNNMTKIVGKSPDGSDENSLMKSRRENPVDFDTKLYYIYEMTKGFTDFSSLTKAGKSQAVKELENAYRTNTRSTGGGSNNFQDQDNTYMNLGDELNI